jgi:hypothetical protein
MFENDAATLADQIQKDFRVIPEPDNWIWTQPVAPKVLDCVMSLRKPYRSVVEPRIKAFVAENDAIRTCTDLRSGIDSFADPLMFLRDRLRFNSPGKATAISQLIDYLLEIQRRFDGDSEAQRLKAWARWCRPGDYLTLEIRGFGLAGFQYLRMLFGADTVKPDVHIIRYVEKTLDQKVSDIRSVYLVERAGELLGLPTRNLDVAIWTRGADQTATP